MSEIEDPGLLKTGIRLIHQRYCLKCGKILPTELKRNFIRVENILSDLIEDTGLLKTGIRVVKSERFQRYCLKCGKILPTKIKQNYSHNCEKPDFLL